MYSSWQKKIQSIPLCKGTFQEIERKEICEINMRMKKSSSIMRAMQYQYHQTRKRRMKISISISTINDGGSHSPVQLSLEKIHPCNLILNVMVRSVRWPAFYFHPSSHIYSTWFHPFFLFSFCWVGPNFWNKVDKEGSR